MRAISEKVSKILGVKTYVLEDGRVAIDAGAIANRLGLTFSPAESLDIDGVPGVSSDVLCDVLTRKMTTTANLRQAVAIADVLAAFSAYSGFPVPADGHLALRSLAQRNALCPPRPERRPRRRGQWVYFVRAGSDGPIKIGWADDVRARISTLQIANPQPLALLLAIRGGAKEEAELHRAWAACRVSGEWFQPTPELMAEIERLRLALPAASDDEDEDGPARGRS